MSIVLPMLTLALVLGLIGRPGVRTSLILAAASLLLAGRYLYLVG